MKTKSSKFKKLNKIDKNLIPNTIITPVIVFDDHLNRLSFSGDWYDVVIKELQPFKKNIYRCNLKKTILQ
ncbi:MAG: hypothetical protein ACR5KW_03240 [Wolbachia sp.]